MRLLRRGRIWEGGGRGEGYDQRAGDSSTSKKAVTVTQERDGESLTLLTGGRVEEGRRNEFKRFPQPPKLFTRGCHWQSSLLHLDCSASSAPAVATFNSSVQESRTPTPPPGFKHLFLCSPLSSLILLDRGFSPVAPSSLWEDSRGSDRLSFAPPAPLGMSSQSLFSHSLWPCDFQT